VDWRDRDRGQSERMQRARPHPPARSLAPATLAGMA
jgi:hypothetical protein